MIRVDVDGRPLTARPGDSLLVALVRAGLHPTGGGCLCLGGDCPHCLVTVDGIAYTRSCQMRAADGMKVERDHTGGEAPALLPDHGGAPPGGPDASRSGTPERPLGENRDVPISRRLRAGTDARPRESGSDAGAPDGQGEGERDAPISRRPRTATNHLPRERGSYEAAPRGHGERAARSPAESAPGAHHVHCDTVVIGQGGSGRRAAREARDAGLDVVTLDDRSGQHVTGVYPGPLVVASDRGERVLHVHPRREIVVATGAAEIQPVVPGSGLEGLITARAASELVAAGVDLGRAVAVGERPEGLPEGTLAAHFPLGEGGRELVCFEGEGRVSAVVLREHGDPDARCERIACDTAVLGLGRNPRNALARMAADLPVRVTGAAAAEPELPPCPRAGTVCPCSGVTVADLESVWERGFQEMELLKRATLAGTGACQGGVCLPWLRSFLLERGGRLQPAFTARPLNRQLTVRELAAGAHEPVSARSPLHDEHLRLGARMERAGGWWRPWRYEPKLGEATVAAADEDSAPERAERAADPQNDEYDAVRHAVSLGDVSPLGKTAVSGPDAEAFLERIIPSRVGALAPGTCRYVILLDERGYLLDDGILCRDVTGGCGQRFFLTSTSGGADFLELWLRDWAEAFGCDVRIMNRTAALAAINVTGPRAARLLIRAGARELPAFGRHGKVRIAGVLCRVLRVSFTGELSYELHHAAADAAVLWRRLLAVGDELEIRPHGLQTLLDLRLAKGHLVIGQDTDYDSTPRRLGCEWAVDLEKGDFVGRQAILRTNRQPLDRRLVALELLGQRAAPPGDGRLRGDDREATFAGSALADTQDDGAPGPRPVRPADPIPTGPLVGADAGHPHPDRWGRPGSEHEASPMEPRTARTASRPDRWPDEGSLEGATVLDGDTYAGYVTSAPAGFRRGEKHAFASSEQRSPSPRDAGGAVSQPASSREGASVLAWLATDRDGNLPREVTIRPRRRLAAPTTPGPNDDIDRNATHERGPTSETSPTRNSCPASDSRPSNDSGPASHSGPASDSGPARSSGPASESSPPSVGFATSEGDATSWVIAARRIDRPLFDPEGRRARVKVDIASEPASAVRSFEPQEPQPTDLSQGPSGPPRLRRLEATRVSAAPPALDELVEQPPWPANTLALRTAPDELLATTAPDFEVAGDPDAIIARETAFSYVWLDEAAAERFLDRECEWRRPSARPAFTQGEVAGLEAKLWFEAGRTLILAPSPFAAAFQRRLDRALGQEPATRPGPPATIPVPVSPRRALGRGPGGVEGSDPSSEAGSSAGNEAAGNAGDAAASNAGDEADSKTDNEADSNAGNAGATGVDDANDEAANNTASKASNEAASAPDSDPDSAP